MRTNYFLLLFLQLFIFSSCTKINTEQAEVYKDPTASIDARVQDLLSRMTLEEKIAQMNQLVSPSHMRIAEDELTVEELHSNDQLGFYPGIHSSDVLKMTEKGLIGSFLHVLTASEANELQTLAKKSRLGIPLLIGIDAIHGNGLTVGATIYPTSISIASTFQESLAEKMSIETAHEMRATGSHWAFTPNIDVARDARWGRVGETFGEDPYLVGNMGVAMIKGLQQGDFTGRDKVIACAKHLVGGGEPINGTNAAPTELSYRTLKEVHFPPYERAIKEANVFSIMMAHNEINGIPCHSNSFLMQDLMREEYGFDGFYVSDWRDIERLHSLHHVAENEDDAFALSISSGMDMHMHGPAFVPSMVESVKEGKVSEARINEACAKILEVKFRLGLFEQPFVDESKIDEQVFTKAHQATALEIARKSVILLKNDNILPLNTNKYKNIFITGPNADNQTILGDWASPQPEEHVVTVKQGLEKLSSKYGFNLDYFDCGQMVYKVSESAVNKAAQRAKKADLAVVVVGENSMRHHWREKTCGENTDRAHINLVGRQLELVQKIQKTGTPVVVIYVNGRPIGEPWIEENVAATIEAWEPGSFGGQALAEILLGEVNPSGKLPISIPRTVGQGKVYYSQKPSYFYQSFRFTPNTPLYAFGYGLSYTNFEISQPKLDKEEITAADQLKVTVSVKNTGPVAGDEVVQLYIRDDYSSVTRPIKELKHYQRVSLKAGETKEVSFLISKDDLAFYDQKMNWIVEQGTFTVMVGNSSLDKDLKTVQFNLKETTTLNVNDSDLLI
ncbi:glycoside hydrolase family 3 N-terminal domain-containing protein [Persicobacter psychrovividus]|uniref:beta-glucosidase n=1 Tax=Persicobacter psychrovividus TaxID=387638 RepID=A0ABN6LFJ0_9BACT|nr:beta-glucosidase [Persicobacter psychrovividus]